MTEEAKQQLNQGGRFDTYARRARHAPVLIVTLPVITGTALLFPAFANWNRLWLLAVSAGLLTLINQLGRDSGYRLQGKLWKSWGGPPTTLMLRHGQNTNSILLEHRHAAIVRVTGIDMPNKTDEKRNPKKADEKYGAAVSRLISLTRNAEQFPLIFKESCHYGFRRNMLGLRRAGVSICSVAAVAPALSFIPAIRKFISAPATILVLISGISIVFLSFWLLAVKPQWVKRAGDAYASRLLEALDILPEKAK
ncbi:hypothetical protein [Umezawaea tangerina]|uniref:Uncharacterized protein n=1 Tax=Umezawaea tangerina TaxID=84725 RepID=A0A2T0TLM7_9PSEU|nr:hypothetical protein [Umezawaea tangerina]PRY46622.1 hypothetical protein CLV43_101900 [Umezawaea tangerina]